MQINMQQATSNLGELVDAALSDHEVIIARDNRPMDRLVPVMRNQPFRFGLLVGLAGEGPDWFEPMAEDDLRLWDGHAT